MFKKVYDSDKARVIVFLRVLAWLLPLIMLPVSLYLIPYIDEKKWRSESTGFVFDNMNLDDNSFLGGGNKFGGLHRDTVLFNRSHINKSISGPSFLTPGDKDKRKQPSFLQGLQGDKYQTPFIAGKKINSNNN